MSKKLDEAYLELLDEKEKLTEQIKKQDQQIANLKAENKQLKQQLKEKEKEIQQLQKTIKDQETLQSWETDWEQSLKEKNKRFIEEWESLLKYYIDRITDEDYENKIKANTHQVCEKIRQKAEKQTNMLGHIRYAIKEEILSQIEKGEINAENGY